MKVPYLQETSPNGNGILIYGSSVFTGAAPPAHSFPNWGGYDVQLIVTSGGTCKDTITQMIGVYPIPVPDFVATTECLGTATSFTDLSDIAFGSVESRTYDFDDNGVITNNSNPLHTFSTFGTFDVNLTNTSDFGCEEDTVLHRACSSGCNCRFQRFFSLPERDNSLYR